MVRGLDWPFLLEEGEVIFPAGVSLLKAEEGDTFCEGRAARLRDSFFRMGMERGRGKMRICMGPALRV